MQALHSADPIDNAVSTGSPDGQATAHFAQSMHASGLRRMRVGLMSATMPVIAPYGHRYRHQKFLTKTESTSSTAMKIALVWPMRRKKFSIFTSATRP